MKTPPTLTDLHALALHRKRALALTEPAMFLQQIAILEIQERLSLVKKAFTKPAVVTPFPDIWGAAFAGAKIVPDDPTLNLAENEHDLVIHAMGLHWSNDPVGQMVQARSSLKPDGLFLAVFFGGETLFELRDALTRAEVAETGGLSPRIAPMGEIRDLGGLLQRAGFALPVADTISLNTSYETPLGLMLELRAMGENNALADRNRRLTRRRVLQEALELYVETYGANDRIPATFELMILTGWAPDANQPKALKPGSATSRLADALETKEQGTSDRTIVDRV